MPPISSQIQQDNAGRASGANGEGAAVRLGDDLAGRRARAGPWRRGSRLQRRDWFPRPLGPLPCPNPLSAAVAGGAHGSGAGGGRCRRLAPGDDPGALRVRRRGGGPSHLGFPDRGGAVRRPRLLANSLARPGGERRADRPATDAGLRLAEHLVAIRARDEARDVLATASAQADALGARLVGDPIRALARRAGLAAAGNEAPRRPGPAGRADRSGDRGAPAGGGGADQRRYRDDAVHQHQDRQRARVQHLGQTRSQLAERGGRDRAPAVWRMPMPSPTLPTTPSASSPTRTTCVAPRWCRCDQPDRRRGCHD